MCVTFLAPNFAYIKYFPVILWKICHPELENIFYGRCDKLEEFCFLHVASLPSTHSSVKYRHLCFLKKWKHFKNHNMDTFNIFHTLAPLCSKLASFLATSDYVDAWSIYIQNLQLETRLFPDIYALVCWGLNIYRTNQS